MDDETLEKGMAEMNLLLGEEKPPQQTGDQKVSTPMEFIKNRETVPMTIQNFAPVMPGESYNPPDFDASRWRFDEFNATVAGGMVGGTVGMTFGGPPGMLIGSALGAEGTRRGALAANELIDWVSDDEDVILGVESYPKMLSETIDSASTIMFDMAFGGLGTEIGAGWQKIRGVLGAGKSKVTGVIPSELYEMMRQMKIKSNVMITGNPFIKLVSEGFANIPSSARTMHKAIAETYDGIERNIKDIAEDIFFGHTTTEKAGRGLKKTLDFYSDKVQELGQYEFNKLLKMGIDNNDAVEMPLTRAYLASRKAAMRDAGEVAEFVYPRELDQVLNAIDAERTVGGRAEKVIFSDTSDLIVKHGEGGTDIVSRGNGNIPDIDEKFEPDFLEFMPGYDSMHIPGIDPKIAKESGKLPWGVVQAFKSKEGFVVKNSVGDEVNMKALRGLFATIASDMEQHVLKKGGSDALNQYKKAKKVYRQLQMKKDALRDISNSTLAQDAFDASMSGSRHGRGKLLKLKAAVTSVTGKEPYTAGKTGKTIKGGVEVDMPRFTSKKTPSIYRSESGQVAIPREPHVKVRAGNDTWNEFVSANFMKMGLAKPGNQFGIAADKFSLNQFMSSYSGLKQSGSLDVMFSTPQLKKVKPHLEKLVTVMSEIKDLDKYINFSHTAPVAAAIRGIQGGYGAYEGYKRIGIPGLVLGPIAAIKGPHLIAKGLTNPKFVKFLAQGAEMALPQNNSPLRILRMMEPNGARLSKDITRRLHGTEAIATAFGRWVNRELTAIVKEDPSMAPVTKAYLNEMSKIQLRESQQNEQQQRQ